jgi:hypothetical protein
VLRETSAVLERRQRELLQMVELQLHLKGERVSHTNLVSLQCEH